MSSPTNVGRSSNASISDALTDLALDMRWSFNHAADRLWEQLDPELWELTHNPWVVLQTVSQEKLQSGCFCRDRWTEIGEDFAAAIDRLP